MAMTAISATAAVIFFCFVILTPLLDELIIAQIPKKEKRRGSVVFL